MKQGDNFSVICIFALICCQIWLATNTSSQQSYLVRRQVNSPCEGSSPQQRQSTATFFPKTLKNFSIDEGFDPVDTPFVLNRTVVSAYLEFFGIQSKPLVYVITPTYRRPTQMVDLVQMSQSLQHDKAIYWIVIEDAEQGSKRVRDILERSGLLFAHVAIKSPSFFLNMSKEERVMLNIPRGISQRNLGLDTVESIGIPGVVYFGDDDNKYDSRLFENIRYTKGVGIFSVGFRGGALYSRCFVHPESGKVTRVISRWHRKKRNFGMDMAGFCIHTELIKRAHARFNGSLAGVIEHTFLEQVITDISQMEPLLNNCTLVYAWHVRTDVGFINDTIPRARNDPLEQKVVAGV